LADLFRIILRRRSTRRFSNQNWKVRRYSLSNLDNRAAIKPLLSLPSPSEPTPLYLRLREKESVRGTPCPILQGDEEKPACLSRRDVMALRVEQAPFGGWAYRRVPVLRVEQAKGEGVCPGRLPGGRVKWKESVTRRETRDLPHRAHYKRSGSSKLGLAGG
jgi:hypothetical protein